MHLNQVNFHKIPLMESKPQIAWAINIKTLKAKKYNNIINNYPELISVYTLQMQASNTKYWLGNFWKKKKSNFDDIEMKYS